MRIARSIFILGLMSAATMANGQVIISLLLGDKLNSGKVEFGLDGGWNFSSQSGQPKTGLMTSFNLGFYFDIKLLIKSLLNGLKETMFMSKENKKAYKEAKKKSKN